MMPSRGYLLCCIERTGSNFLGGALIGTNIAGKPREYFNPIEQHRPWIRDILGDSNSVDGLLKVLEAGTTQNSVFGSKIHWNHFRYLGMSATGEWNDSERVAMYNLLRPQASNFLDENAVYEILGPRFSDLQAHTKAYGLLRSYLPDLAIVWLRRRDMAARAVSHYRAKISGVWYQTAHDIDTSQPAQLPDPDFTEIHVLNSLGVFQEAMWQRFFEQHSIYPHVVFYEDLIADRTASVREVLAFLQIDSQGVHIPEPPCVKQSDALSENWCQRYRAWATDKALSK